MRDGYQCLLLNEFDTTKNFYKVLDAEYRIRNYAKEMPNSYHLGMFACSKQILSVEMIGSDQFKANELAVEEDAAN